MNYGTTISGYPAKPGFHSYNWHRRLPLGLTEERRDYLLVVLLVVGLVAVCIVGALLIELRVVPAYQDWMLQQVLDAHRYSFSDLVRTKVLRRYDAAASPGPEQPAPGQLLGRMQLGASAEEIELRQGEGKLPETGWLAHAPGSALPGDAGLCAVAMSQEWAGRLDGITIGATITITKPGAVVRYWVASTRVVGPAGLARAVSGEPTGGRLAIVAPSSFDWLSIVPEYRVIDAQLDSVGAPIAPAATAEAENVAVPVVSPAAKPRVVVRPLSVRRLTRRQHSRIPRRQAAQLQLPVRNW